ncbi:PLP-dependent aminotransferase family protein [Aurantimonas sp. VKM B-3413]|uniref:MocR-like ectoine utilization transcription factor EhuR n=1 Tax=Aurantimonas sp. VKM B-3413 TaxID=2779401 RepID=UPI001E5BE6A4|nr:PLP-dependent aminotransferase family protein [Aurantimonas sp. VKM B-3413]MCB8836417.1 PLP-dependent aminotransferase family protein [Aurantimonas sp. VKM B-3413]
MTMWFLNRDALKRPVYLSLADQIARAVLDGKLAVGARLPPHRTLADDLHVSVQTVSRAYEELIRRGLLSGETGRGTFVRPQRSEAALPYLPERLGELVDLSILKPICEDMHLDRMRKALVSLAESLPPSTVLSFRPNVIFPRHRSVASEWLKLCGLTVPPSNICLTNGATGGMTTALLAVATSGSTIATEGIGCHTLIPLASYLGLELAGLELDDDGIVPEALAEACEKSIVRALFVQPNVINPTATLMSLKRREALVEIARKYDIAIIEDDVLGPLVEKRPPPIAALAPERTIYITSFTKTVMPGLRTGYLAVPDRMLSAVVNRHLVTNWIATPMVAEIATRWVANGTAMELVKWQRQAIRKRQAIARELLSGIEFKAHPEALHVWLPLSGGREESLFIAQARLRGVAIAPGSSFRTGEVRQTAVRISVGSTSEEEFRTGMGVISSLIRSDPEPLLLAI